MSDNSNPSEQKNSFKEIAVAITSVVLVVGALVGGLAYAGSPVAGTATSCTVIGVNEMGTKTGIMRTVYTEGCNGDSGKEMFYLHVSDSAVEQHEIYDSIEVDKTYDFEITRPRIPIFAKTASVTALTLSK